MAYSFVITGGGTGGHVFPALAVARVLRERGHRLLFIGTREGMEARLVPEAGFDMEFVRVGALNRVGLGRRLQTMAQLPSSIAAARRLLRKFGAQAVFSLGGYVAGPVMLASLMSGKRLIVMEPNAIPGFANRRVARWVHRALVGFEMTRKFFPQGRSEVTGVPVRAEFFEVEPKRQGPFTVLITGGSQGSRTLNRAARESWKLIRESGARICLLHQTGTAEHEALSKEFSGAGICGEIVPFIRDMPAAFAQADLVVGRSGAGGVNEIAAAGMPSILVPFPFAADDHQRTNAELLVKAGAARMIPDAEMTGERLSREIEELRQNAAERDEMRARVRQFARPGAAQRAADILEEAAHG